MVSGTTSSTCWARGGICIDIRECGTAFFDASVTGCTKGFKVCCKVLNFGPPTVGQNRRHSDATIHSNLDELDMARVTKLAMKNNEILWNYLNHLLKPRRQ